MQTNQVSAAPSLGVEGNLFGNSGVDVSLYVQLLLVKDYDDQLKDSAHQIKISNKLKEAYRRQKQTISELYGKEKDKDGKVTLTRQELALLESGTNFAWDKNKNGGQGGVVTRYKNNPAGAQSEAYRPVDYAAAGNPLIAAHQKTIVWGDPHIIDADGGQWDFQGVAGETYQYLKDSNLEINATHKAWNGNLTVIGEWQGLVHTREGSFNIMASPNQFTVNGQVMTPGTFQQLGNNASVSVEGSKLILSTPEYTSVVEQRGGQYLDFTVNSKAQGVLGDGIAPDGITGHTFDADAVSTPASETALREKYRIDGFSQVDDSEVKVDKGKIEAEMERLQMEVDNLNGNSELISLTLQTLTNQRKTAFETVSNIFSKSAEAANNIARNIGR